MKIEIVCDAEESDKVVETIASAASTGKIGDGKIWVVDVAAVTRIRTGERGTERALSAGERQFERSPPSVGSGALPAELRQHRTTRAAQAWAGPPDVTRPGPPSPHCECVRRRHRPRARLATEAGRCFSLRVSDLTGDDLRKAGDHQSNELLLERLAAERPNDAVLSEESADSPARLAAERVWIIDPLDGTREFGEVLRVDWAVHVALWVEGQLVGGAVALPGMGRTLVSHPAAALPPRMPGRRVSWSAGPGHPR